MANTAKICKNCTFVKKEEGFFGTRYECALMVNDYGHYQRVSETGTCSRFSPKNTPESMGYKGNTSCFLTSACVDYYGKPDDCEELTFLRRFRDKQLKQTEEGRRLVEEYYQVAPKIVEKINDGEDKAETYEYIYKTVCECVESIKRERYDETAQLYQSMVLCLKEKYLEE